MTAPSRPVAVITGASSGIGEEFARRYAREGFDLVVVARTEKKLRELAAHLSEQHGVAVDVHVADLATQADSEAVAHKIEHELPRLDHVVNCAGVAMEGDLNRLDAQEVRAMLDLNISALTLLSRAAIIRMRAQRHGTVVNIASGAAYQPTPHLAAYGASKAYVLMVTEALSEENRRHGVRVLAVSPGDTDTPMNPGLAKKPRKPEQVVETTWRAISGTKPSRVDGRQNAFVAMLTSRFLTRRYRLRMADKMTRHKA